RGGAWAARLNASSTSVAQAAAYWRVGFSPRGASAPPRSQSIQRCGAEAPRGLKPTLHFRIEKSRMSSVLFPAAGSLLTIPDLLFHFVELGLLAFPLVSAERTGAFKADDVALLNR